MRGVPNHLSRFGVGEIRVWLWDLCNKNLTKPSCRKNHIQTTAPVFFKWHSRDYERCRPRASCSILRCNKCGQKFLNNELDTDHKSFPRWNDFYKWFLQETSAQPVLMNIESALTHNENLSSAWLCNRAVNEIWYSASRACTLVLISTRLNE